MIVEGFHIIGDVFRNALILFFEEWDRTLSIIM